MASHEPRTISLEFDSEKLIINEDTDLRQGLSAVANDGDDLWLACDEGCRLERLSLRGTGDAYAGHRTFPLDELLRLPAKPKEEADVEGMDIDEGWLWLVGSHSLKRKKPKGGDLPRDVAARLAKTERDGNRHLLARIPLAASEPVRTDGERRAGGIATSPTSSALLDAIVKHDVHLTPFVSLPGKDNGLDIEGLAVRGNRVFVGLRGPVLREWCCVIELLVEPDGDLLNLVPLDGDVPYRKHFHKLNGLGIRDLVVLEDDVLVLAGPPMAHDGPTEIWRWKNGAKPGAGVAAADVMRLLVLPQRENVDRAEGFTVFEPGEPTSLLVVFDTPDPRRLTNNRTVVADVYRLP